MLLIILGAGASFDISTRLRTDQTDFDQGWRLPLANQLFSEERFGSIIRKHEHCANLFPRLRAGLKDGETLEKLLEELALESEKNMLRARQLIYLRLYIREVIDHQTNSVWDKTHTVTNYGELLEVIETWRSDNGEQVAIVTFNYDTLINQALFALTGLHFRTFESMVQDPRYQLYKVHGCINWYHRLHNWKQIQVGSQENPQWGGFLEGEESDSVPAIAVPTVHKSGFECPENHLFRLKHDLKEIDRLLVIGWRGADQHFIDFWKPLEKVPIKKALIVGKSSADSNHLIATLRDADIDFPTPQCVNDGFTYLFDSNQLSSYLFNDG